MRKYLMSGEVVEEVGRVGDQILIQKLCCALYGDEEQVEAGPLELVDEKAVFSEPPKAKLDAEIATRKSELQGILDAIFMARDALSKAERESKERIARLSRLAALEHLEDWIEGRITHYYDPSFFRIIDRNNTACNYDAKRYRLLSLYGDSFGNIAWELGQYSDGSGNGTVVVPCRSYEEARTRLAESVAGWRDVREYALPGLVESAHAHQVAVPNDLLTKSTEYRLKEMHRQLQNYKPNCEKLEADIANLEGILALRGKDETR